GAEDAVYPNPEGDGGGRLGVDQEQLTDEELEDIVNSNARLPALFEGIENLVFTIGDLGVDAIDLSQYFSSIYLNEAQEIDEEFIHDPALFSFAIIDKPSWVSKVEFDGLILTATAKPTGLGSFYLQVEAYDEDSATT